jgi:hypothetical protein
MTDASRTRITASRGRTIATQNRPTTAVRTRVRRWPSSASQIGDFEFKLAHFFYGLGPAVAGGPVPGDGLNTGTGHGRPWAL